MRILAAPKRDVHTGNPYVTLLYERIEALGATVTPFSIARLLSGRYDVAHFHWPQGRFQGRSAWSAFLRASKLLLGLAVHRLCGGKVVWTVHNILPHDRQSWRGGFLYAAVFCRLVTHLVFLSSSSVAPAYDAFPMLKKAKKAIIPHGHYRDVCPPVPRLRSSAGDVTIGFFGSIKPYKNVCKLLEVFQRMDAPNARLVVHGKPDSAELTERLRRRADGDRRITLDLRHIDDAEVAAIHSRIDLVVLPFSDILNSGSAIMALSQNCRVLVPARGAMVELAELVGAEWVRTFEGELTVAILAKAVAWATASSGTMADLEALSWATIGEKHVELFGS